MLLYRKVFVIFFCPRLEKRTSYAVSHPPWHSCFFIGKRSRRESKDRREEEFFWPFLTFGLECRYEY